MSNNLVNVSNDNNKSNNLAAIFRPKNLDEAMVLAKAISDSGLAPKDFNGNPQKVLIAIQLGAEIGLSPIQAVQNIAVINGRPTLWGDSLLAIAQSHIDFQSIEEVGDEQMATCIIKRKGMNAVKRTFTMAEAIKAGIANRGVWTTYPKRMLQMRARAFAIRDTFADALKGMQSREEVEDYVPKTTYKKMPIIHAEMTASPDDLMVFNDLIQEANVTQETIDKWLKKADVSKIDDLPNDVVEKCIEYLKKKINADTSLQEIGQ